MTTPIPAPIVYLITAGDASAENFEQKKAEIVCHIRSAAKLGVPLVQIREKRLSAKLLLMLVREAVEAAAGSGTRLLVNGRADVAAAAGADGVHLTAASPSARSIRESFGNDLLIGVSCHTAEDVADATAGGADFAVFGPVFATPGKSAPVGTSDLAAVCAENKGFPVIALGGIDHNNYRSALNAGASGFAAIRALNDEAALERIMNEIRSI